MPWTVVTLSAAVDGEIAALPADMRARLVRLTELIEQIGFEALPRDCVKHLEGKLRELRITGRDGISRAIYVTAAGRRGRSVSVLTTEEQDKAARHTRAAS